MNRHGFTLIELTLLIAIVGIIAVYALPGFIALSGDSREAIREAEAQAVRAGISLARARDLMSGGSGEPPSSLDAAGSCCFGNVLDAPVSDGSWTAEGDTYTHRQTGKSYRYDSRTGEFIKDR
ncbi:MAG: type II secretion system protein [Proteobacteria bacterium]|nr:type II secretion system protein [Pseudomonadota bacterium]